MARSEKATITAMCMIYNGSKLLLQDRIDESWSGITFAGGHIEKGESFIGGITREILEETGLTVKNLRICGVKQFQTENDERYIVLLFKTNEFEGKLTSSDEGEMLWIERSELHNHRLASGFLELLSVFDNDEINEMYYSKDFEGNWSLSLL